MSREETLKIAHTLVKACQEGKELEQLDNLYAANATSAESIAMEGDPGRVVEGLEGIKGKHAWWEENFEVHSAETVGPFLHGDDRFGVIFRMDTTHKASAQRSQMEELGIYTVENGKIVSEEFYYNMPQESA